MPKGSTRNQQASSDAPADDDLAMPIETVIARLQLRSKDDRKALIEALMDGGTLHSDTHPVSGTISYNDYVRAYDGLGMLIPASGFVWKYSHW
jgi:hypothetical protein